MKKIGIVKSVNARPLTWGFENNGNYETISDTPARLAEMLLDSKLDAALISSVECVRHDILEYYPGAGVCTRDKVKSILYFKNRTESLPHTVYVDNGSRSSVALLKILFQLEHKRNIETIAAEPETIQKMIHAGKGHHMLFGDNALFASWDSRIYESIDLSGWWNKLTGMPFCYAFWAYRRDNPVDTAEFDWSLQKGLAEIDKIIARHQGFEPDMLRNYLSNDLHYRTNPDDLEGFQLFVRYCKKFNIC